MLRFFQDVKEQGSFYIISLFPRMSFYSFRGQYLYPLKRDEMSSIFFRFSFFLLLQGNLEGESRPWEMERSAGLFESYFLVVVHLEK